MSAAASGLSPTRGVDVIVFVGPSGCGKSTIIQRLQQEWPSVFKYRISHTTRPPRAGEENGRHYHFVSPDDFKRLIQRGAMVEYTKLSSQSSSTDDDTTTGHFYGTSKQALYDVLQQKGVVLMDADFVGALNLRRYFQREAAELFTALAESSNPTLPPCSGKRGSGRAAQQQLRCLIIFIAPPDMSSLEERLRHRRTETEESLQMRLRVSSQWMELAKRSHGLLDYYVVNDNLEECYQLIVRILQKEMQMTASSL